MLVSDYRSVLSSSYLARINLDRPQVPAPVNGIFTNFALRPAAYATTSQPVMALVDLDSFYVAGYFEETKLSHIHIGMPATIHIMGEVHSMQGHVQSLSAGIEDRERTTASGTLLANVNPTFSLVRLAQRIPVRIDIDQVPPGMALIAGRTATIAIGREQA